MLVRKAFLTVCLFSVSLFSAAEQDHYTVGIVPQFEAKKLYSIWRPILDRLSEQTGVKFKIMGSSTIPSFEQEFTEGRFDFAYMNPYHLVVANASEGYVPLVRDVDRMLHGVLVARDDSGITNPKQLEGRVLAFPAPNALGASLLMRQELADDFNISFRASFVKTHDSVYLNVLLGEASAGGGVQKTLNRQKPHFQKALRVIHRTKEVVPHPFSAHPKVPEKIRSAVKDAFIALGTSDKELFAKIPMKKVGSASLEEYLPLLELGLERFTVKTVD